MSAVSMEGAWLCARGALIGVLALAKLRNQ